MLACDCSVLAGSPGHNKASFMFL